MERRCNYLAVSDEWLGDHCTLEVPFLWSCLVVWVCVLVIQIKKKNLTEKIIFNKFENEILFVNVGKALNNTYDYE